jgi:AcrR family transcriptional regulator
MPYAVKAMPRPRSLTQTDLAGAALAVVDRGGLTALTMRAVARELGMGTMSLYRYVRDREQIELLLIELVLTELDVVPPPEGSWRTRVTVLLERIRAAVAEHPAIAPLLPLHRGSSTAMHRWVEAVLRVLTEAGFTGRRRVIALRALLSYTLGAIQLEHLGPLTGPGTDALAALPRDTYPLLAETANQARGLPVAEEFRQGAGHLLRGLGEPD